MAALLILWALTGGMISAAIMMHIWLPDPPPDVMRKYIGTLIAAAVGGIVGGAVINGLAGSNPMPGSATLAAGAAGLIVAGGVALMTAGAGKIAR